MKFKDGTFEKARKSCYQILPLLDKSAAATCHLSVRRDIWHMKMSSGEWVIPLVRHFISFHLLEEIGEFIFMTLENEAAKQLLLLPPVSCEKHRIVVCACDSCAKVHSQLIKRPTVHFIDMSSMCDCRAQGLYRVSCQAQLRYFQNSSFCEYLASTFLLPLQTSAHSGRSGRRSGGNACLRPVEE